jgi:hypothetical protein
MAMNSHHAEMVALRPPGVLLACCILLATAPAFGQRTGRQGRNPWSSGVPRFSACERFEAKPETPTILTLSNGTRLYATCFRVCQKSVEMPNGESSAMGPVFLEVL